MSRRSPEEPYQIAWEKRARRVMELLPEKVVAAVVEFVYGALAENPQRVGHALHSDYRGLYSARRGQYRVIYEIDDERRVVTIDSIAHRSDAYRPRS
jgi:mRNA-degrading endonuclease RelE of RelBE toxin-antitoxin system